MPITIHKWSVMFRIFVVQRLKEYLYVKDYNNNINLF